LSKDTKFFHVVDFDDVQKVLKEGLKPYVPYEEPKIDAVFLWDDLRLAKKFAEYKYEEDGGGLYAILEVQVPPDVKAEKRLCVPKARKAGFACEWLIKGTIPPKNLKIIFRNYRTPEEIAELRKQRKL